MSEKKIIYSQKYPKNNSVKINYELQNIDQEELLIAINELFKDMDENTVYKPNPEREENRKHFIGIGKIISQEFQIDTEISEDEHFIAVDFLLEYGPINMWVRRFLAHLVELSDSIYLSNKPDGLGLNLTYFVCDMYYKGELIKFKA